MKLYPLPVLILAILAAAVLGGLYWHTGSAKARLETAHAALQIENRQLQDNLSSTETRNETLQKELTVLDIDLGETKTALTSARSQNIIQQRQLNELQQSLETARETQRDLRDEIEGLNRALAQARADAASPESIAAYQQTISELRQKLAASRAAYDPITPTVPVLTTHRSRSTRVVSVGPSSAFVVLNYGSAHGALPTQIMSIRRGTKTLASVQISDVRDHYSIAQVRPDSLRDTLQKGDAAILTP